MFNGNASISFRSSKTKSDVLKVVEEQLEIMGSVNVSSTGNINLSGSRFNGFSYKPNIEGKVSERDGRFSVYLDFQAKPNFMGWLIAICFFPIGCTIFILPNNAKNEIQRKADQSLSEIKAILNEY